MLADCGFRLVTLLEQPSRNVSGLVLHHDLSSHTVHKLHSTVLSVIYVLIITKTAFQRTLTPLGVSRHVPSSILAARWNIEGDDTVPHEHE